MTSRLGAPSGLAQRAEDWRLTVDTGHNWDGAQSQTEGETFSVRPRRGRGLESLRAVGGRSSCFLLRSLASPTPKGSCTGKKGGLNPARVFHFGRHQNEKGASGNRRPRSSRALGCAYGVQAGRLFRPNAGGPNRHG